MKLLLVEDHLFIAESLELLMQEDMQMVVANSCTQAIQIIKSSDNFDIILLDMGLPDSDGISLLNFFHTYEYFPPVLVITGRDNAADLVASCRTLGARGFYHKSQSPKVLLEAVAALLMGEEFWPRGIDVQELDEPESDRAALAREFGVTPRQLEVLQYLDEGLQNKEIAEVMKISDATVKTHIKALYVALGARTRGGCVKTARQLGLL